MAKNSKASGPSDVNQPGVPLHLQNAEVVPGTSPEKANVATTLAVEEADLSDEERAERLEERQEAKAQEREEAEPEAPAEDVDELDLDEDELDDPEVEEDDADDLPTPDEEVVGPTTSTVEYDPSVHTVDEVNTYLAEQLEEGNEEEVERVLALEQSSTGKNRSGILSRFP